MSRQGCPLWVLGDVSEEEIAAAQASLPPGARLCAISDEGTISYVEPTRREPYGRGPICAPDGINWLKEALRR